jgi:soluble cytochrome b562
VAEPKTIYYGMARLSDLVKLHVAHGKSLYEQNIRYFLGSQKSDVNKAIKQTLQDKPADFFYLNNGVTAIGQTVASKTAKEPGFKKLQVKGLSIINGVQTVASSAEFVAQFPDKNIEAAWVMLTLIQADADADFSAKVTKARNNQNNVEGANFVSLDPLQERLRRELATVGVDYQYRPEAALVDGGPLVIRLDEAVRALAAMSPDPRYIAWLKSEPDTLKDVTSSRYKTLFHDTLSGLQLANVAICNNAIRETIDETAESVNPKSKERRVYREGLHVICAVLIKRLRHQIQTGKLLEKVTVQALISHPLDELRQQAFDLASNAPGSEDPSKFFTNQNQVLPFMMTLMERNYELSNDPAISALRNTTSSDRDALYPQQRLNDYLIQQAPQL